MIISFYSYKGGVGRTQLCANIAAYLCYKKNKKVLLWDWDYEAPGLHYFFNKINSDIVKKGTLELLEDYAVTIRKSSELHSSELKYISEEENITNLVSGSPSGGSIDLIAAGIYDENFSYRSNNFDWFEFYNMLDGANYIEKVKENLALLKYDYILIDSRTGISDYSGICNIQLPDLNVMVVAPTMQNFEGCKSIIGKIINSEYLKIKKRLPQILPVLSRLDRSNPSYNTWVFRFTEYYSKIIRNLDPEFDDEYLNDVFADIYYKDTFIPYTPAISAGENILFDTRISNTLTDYSAPFKNIGELIESLNHDGKVSFYKRIDEIMWLNYGESNVKLSGQPQKREKGEEIINYRRKSSIAYTQVGLKQSSPELQLEFCQKAFELDNTYFLAYYGAGTACINKSDFNSAIDFLNTAVKLKPDFAEANYSLALAYYNCVQNDLAKEYFQKALGLNPAHADAKAHLNKLENEPETILTSTQLKKQIDIERGEKVKIEEEIKSVKEEKLKLESTFSFIKKKLVYLVSILGVIAVIYYGYSFISERSEASNYIQDFKKSIDSLKYLSGTELLEKKCNLAATSKYDDDEVMHIKNVFKKECKYYRNLQSKIGQSDSIIAQASASIIYDSAFAKSILKKAGEIDDREMKINLKVNQIKMTKDSALILKLMKDTADLERDISKIVFSDTILKKTTVASDLYVKSELQKDSLLNPHKGPAQPFKSSSWFKKGYYLLFDNIKVLLNQLSNKDNIITVEISDVSGGERNARKINTLTLYIGRPETFYYNNFRYSITLDKIGRAGKNPFTLAAYISFEKEYQLPGGEPKK